MIEGIDMILIGRLKEEGGIPIWGDKKGIEFRVDIMSEDALTRILREALVDEKARIGVSESSFRNNGRAKITIETSEIKQLIMTISKLLVLSKSFKERAREELGFTQEDFAALLL